jgi:prepilin-type processing-associated H-X9-DG protein
MGVSALARSLLSCLPVECWEMHLSRKQRKRDRESVSDLAQPAPVRRTLSERQAGVLLVVAAILAISIPSFVRYDELSRRARCGDHLSLIGRACLNYSIDYRGPAMSLRDFVQAAAAANLRPEQMLCAECGEVFVYVDGPRGIRDPRDVLAYEPPEYHGGKGGNVLFVDGAVKWLTPAALEEAIDATLARQEGAAPQPG